MTYRRTAFLLLLVVLVVPLVVVSASNIEYHLERQWVKIWINRDGTIDLQYGIEIACDKGEIRYVDIDQPTGDFTIGYAHDSLDRSLKVEDASEGGDYEVRVYLAEKLKAGETIFFTVTTNVGQMIWKDEQNPGNVGMQFIPCTWNAEVRDLRVLILFPQGVDKSEVRNTPDWDNIYVDEEEDRLAIYWERYDLAPNEAFTVGVSFPEGYVEGYETKQLGIFERVWWLTPLLTFIPFAAIFLMVIGGIIYSVRKRPYLAPHMKMESLGVKRGLTAVEAAYLLDLKPERIVTMILYSLLKKQAVWIKESDPVVKVEIMEDYKDFIGDREKQLRYYEKDFLKSITKKGALDEKKLAQTYMSLRNFIENKLRGYCRQDTVSYYKKTVKKAWNQVEGAGTPELASKAYDEHLLWLLLDEGYKERTGSVFEDKDFTPEPWWWWYWYTYTYHHPRPTYIPRKDQTPPKIPGSEVADNIATALEKTAGNIVTNLEKFANSILPAPKPSKTSHEPAHHKSSCVCACHACACACACVSCACACAGGGGVG